MKNTRIFYNKKIKLNKPILLVGLPGIGNVGSLVVEHLKNELKAQKLATLYSPHFLHQALMLKSGGLRLVSNRFYVKDLNGYSLILLLGDTQAGSPEGQYEVNEKIIKFFKHLGGKEVYTIGGYSSGGQYVHKPRVFGVATDKKTKDELEKKGIIFGKATGAIWGSAGLIVTFAKKHGMRSACIMGETGLLEIDANAAISVLRALKDILGININLENMDKIKRETEKIIKEMEQAQRGMGAPPPKDNMSYIR